jgi:hypothetical protein
VVVINLGTGRMVGGSLCGWGMACRRARHKGALQEHGGARQKEPMGAGCREFRGRGQKLGVDRVVGITLRTRRELRR